MSRMVKVQITVEGPEVSDGVAPFSTTTLWHGSDKSLPELLIALARAADETLREIG